MMENARHKVKKDGEKWENEIAFRNLGVQMNEDRRWSNDGTWKEIHAVVSERRQSWLTIGFPIFNNHRIDKYSSCQFNENSYTARKHTVGNIISELYWSKELYIKEMRSLQMI